MINRYVPLLTLKVLNLIEKITIEYSKNKMTT